MILTTFSKICLVCGLIVSRVQITFADDSAGPPLNPSNAKFGSKQDRGQLICALLDAIEQNHVDPPSRRELIRVVTRALTGLGDRTRSYAIDNEILRMLDAEILLPESVRPLNDLIDRLDTPTVSFDQFTDEFVRNFNLLFEEDLGEIRLIRSKDHDVEEQFRGNRYVGLGVNLRVDPENRLPVVFAGILPGGPAERGGLPTGTVVHEIDGRATQGVPTQTIIDWIRGPQGTDVTLRVSFPNSAEEKRITLKRGVVRFDSLKSKDQRSLSDDNLRFDQGQPIAWINVTEISSSTLHEFRSAEALCRANKIRVLILDLRHSIRSGDLHQGLLIADSFLDGGEIWKQAERGLEPQIKFADQECLFRGIPLLVLVNRQTKPVNCAIASALQDAGRAKIVGECPQFQGWIPKTVRLQDVPFSLEMRTSRLTRTGQNHGWPLEPDVHVGLNSQPVRADVLVKLDEELSALSRKVDIERRVSPNDREVVAKLVNEMTELVRRIQMERQAINRSVTVSSEMADAVAIRVARELLETLTVNQKQ